MSDKGKPKGVENPAPTAFRNRIVGEGVEAPDQLLANPRNWRAHPKHQVDALECGRQAASQTRARSART